MKKMLDYSGPEYENLYQEILIDSTFTYGKFSPVPYPDFKPRSWVTTPKFMIM